MIIEVKQNQTIWDIALQYCGSIEAAPSILAFNGKTNTSLVIGETIKIPNILNAKLQEYYYSQGIVLASSLNPLDSGEFIPPSPNPLRKVSLSFNGMFVEEIYSPSDVDYSLKDVNSNTIVPISISSIDRSITIPNWQRPSHWPPRPSGWENQTGVHMLVENVGYNLVYFVCDQDVDLYVNGDLFLSIPANSTLTKLIELFPEDFVSIEHGDTQWIWLYFDIPNGASVSWYANSTTLTGHLTGQLYSFLKFLKVAEEIVNMSSLDRYVNTDSGAIYSVKKTVDGLVFRSGCTIANSERLFGDIQLQNLENFPTIQNWGVQTFRGAIIPNLTVLDLDNSVTTLGAAAFFNSFRGRSIRLINSSAFTTLQLSFSGAYFSAIYIEDGSQITPSTNAVGSAYLQELIVNDLASTIAFYGNYFSEASLMRSMASFADLTGTSTQTIYIVGNHAHLDTVAVNDLAAAKNWTLAFN